MVMIGDDAELEAQKVEAKHFLKPLKSLNPTQSQKVFEMQSKCILATANVQQAPGIISKKESQRR